MKTTPLSFLLDVMNSYRDIDHLEDQYKVKALDSQIRELMQGTNYPWNLRKSTLRVFADVDTYAIASDHDELAYIDKQIVDNYYDAARFYNTSLQQFYEQVNSTRNLMADIWKDGERLIGLKAKFMDLSSSQISSAEFLADYTVSDDAANAELDNVVFIDGNGSVKFDIVDSASIATIKNTTEMSSDDNYKTKYQFKWVYLAAVPTNIELKLQTDDSNYLSTVVTEQFDGTEFKADDWNLIAHDLNTATETGSFDKTSIASEEIVITGAATGTYRVDASYLRQWKLLDYWYYSFFNVVTEDSNVADKQFFIDTDEDASNINVADKLLGDHKWFALITWGAMERLFIEVENKDLQKYSFSKRQVAEKKFNAKYPNMTPLITTKRYNFNNEPGLAHISVQGTVND